MEEVRLSVENISNSLRELAGWHFDPSNNTIEKSYTRKNFVDAVSFIQAIVPIAEKNDHHPDILLSDYKKVTIMLSTHSAGGVTQKDFELAREIDKLQ